jgi:nicotinamide-nucleotide amidase
MKIRFDALGVGCQICTLNIELINTGTELMLGFVTNTNQQWLCRELANLGHQVVRQVAVADSESAICDSISEALGRVGLVIVTGGLGPTSDDLTREAVARLMGRPLREDPIVLGSIKEFFLVRGRTMPERTRVQALVPEGATVLANQNGTAPGLALEVDRKPFGGGAGLGFLIMVPGPPRELRPMFLNEVAPLLQRRFGEKSAFHCRTLKTTGLGESMVEETIGRSLQPLIERGLELGYCARFGEVDVRLVSRADNAPEIVSEAEGIARGLLGDYVFGCDADLLENVVVRELTMRGQTVAVGESCTGGYLAHRITNVPGASEVFLGGVISYSNAAKQDLLGVRAETLNAHGAVSLETAREMAEGARARTGATYALAVTGIAGPGGGTPEKPVGTVFLALAGPEPTLVRHQTNAYDRESFKHVTSQQALDMLRRKLSE